MIVVAALVACTDNSEPGDDPPVDDVGTGIVGTGWANPFPNPQQMDESGHLALIDLPSGGETPIPVERLAWRTGFSPSQVSVLRLDGIDPSGFPSVDTITPGEGTVRMVDLTDGRAVACFAELDAYPDADEHALLVRPLEGLPDGHRIAVAVLTDAVPRPARFDAMLSDAPPPSLAEVAPSYRQLVDDLDVFGIPAADIAIAWEFPVADGTAPLKSALAQLTVPGGHTFDRIRNATDGDTVAPYTWRAAEGTFRAMNFVIDDRSLDLQPDGSVAPVGETDALLYVHIPTSVADAPAGSVPIVVFGHGIFGEPADYLDDPGDSGRVNQLADELGVIVLGTTWRGLSASDRIVPIGVASDFATFHELTDLLVQGQTNTRTLIEYASSGGLFEDPVFLGASGQSLPDPSHVSYYGISLGAIEGAVLLAQDPPLDAAAFHVGGASWSTMLERSSNWAAFELFIRAAVESAADRQVLYSLSQLWWDPVDPMSYTTQLTGRSFLLQESIGDDQVPNLTTEMFARTVGLPVLNPVGEVPFGLSAVDGPLPPGSQALVRFDPEITPPPLDNRPAPVTGAHGEPRTWPGARLQVRDHLTQGLEGQIIHHCGDAPCSAENQGVEP